MLSVQHMFSFLDTVSASFCCVPVSTAIRIITFMPLASTSLPVASVRCTGLFVLTTITYIFCFPAIIALATAAVLFLLVHNICFD